MADKIPFFDFFDRFVPPRELRLLLHDAAVTGGVLKSSSIIGIIGNISIIGNRYAIYQLLDIME